MTIFHCNDPVSVGCGLIDVVKDNGDGSAPLINERTQLLHEFAGIEDVEVVQRLAALP